MLKHPGSFFHGHSFQPILNLQTVYNLGNIVLLSYAKFHLFSMKPSLVFLIFAIASSFSAIKATKRGLAWAGASHPQDLLHFNSSRNTLAWSYNWSPSPQDLSTSGLRFIPMQWSSANIQSLSTTVTNLRPDSVLVSFLSLPQIVYKT